MTATTPPAPPAKRPFFVAALAPPWSRWALLAAFFLLLCVHAWQYYPFIADDALITLRYADRLLAGDGLTWTDGEPVEGYSNLLWLLLAALLGLFGVDLIDATRILGVASMAAVLFALTHWRFEGCFKGCSNASARSGDGGGIKRLELLPIIAALLFFTAAAPAAVWTIGGLEQPLYIALIALAIPMTTRVIENPTPSRAAIMRLSLTLGAMSITRPDGPLFAVAVLFSVYVGKRVTGKPFFAMRDAALLLSMPCVFYGGQTVFRLLYYGEWVANTAFVKVAPSLHHFQGGLEYVLGGMVFLGPLSWLAAALTAALAFARPAVGIPLSVMGGAWAAYVVFIGGDVFRDYRHILPLLVVFAFALCGGLRWLAPSFAAWFARRPFGQTHARFAAKARATATMTLAAAFFIPYLHGQVNHFLDKDTPQRQWIYQWVWDGKIIALLLKQSFREQRPLIAISAAGGIAYWSELPAIDVLGLNDRHIARHRPADFGQGWLGHELGDADYVLGRKPDLIVWHTGRLQDRHPTAKQMRERDAFHQLYTPMRLRGHDPDNPRHTHRAEIWARKYDSKIGVSISESEVRIPAYLFSENKHTVAYLDAHGELVIPVSARQPASILVDSALHAEHWQAHVTLSPAADAATPAPPKITTRVSRQGEKLLVELTSPTDAAREAREVTLRPSLPRQ